MVILEKTPFPHVVVDNFLNYVDAHELRYCTAKSVLSSFPDPSEHWYKYDNCFETKFATDKFELMNPDQRYVLNYLNSPTMLRWLESYFEIDGLIPDPYYRGGGLHYIKQGGKLDVHADFNLHPKLKLERRLNVLIYLNEDYKSEYGGQLELWDQTMERCEVSIDPIFNRLVAFETNSNSFHGHPSAWMGPYPRRSIATYYYTVPRGPLNVHSTLYQKLPGTKTTPEIEEFRKKRAKGRQ